MPAVRRTATSQIVSSTVPDSVTQYFSDTRSYVHALQLPARPWNVAVEHSHGVSAARCGTWGLAVSGAVHGALGLGEALERQGRGPAHKRARVGEECMRCLLPVLNAHHSFA